VDRQVSKLRHERSDGADAFIPESAQISGTSDDLAELLGEQYLREASGDESEEGARDDVVPEELGGPFVESGPGEEYGSTRNGEKGDDARVDAMGRPVARPTRNPMPQAVGPLAIAAPDEEAEDESVERNRSEFPLAAAEVRTASLEDEPVSHMEPDIEIDGPDDRDVTTKYPITRADIGKNR
jgi:hypothetical protein